MSLGSIMDDLRNPRKKNIDELPLHEYLDTTVQNLSKDCVFEVRGANSGFSHDSD